VRTLFQEANSNTPNPNSGRDQLRKENKVKSVGEVTDNRTNSIQQAVTFRTLDKEIVVGDNSEVISSMFSSSPLMLNSNR
jgi:hypothetical protein